MENPLPTDPAPDDDPPPLPPQRPTPNDCCYGGCEPCVFDLYDQALERYEAQLRAWHARRQAAAAQKR